MSWNRISGVLWKGVVSTGFLITLYAGSYVAYAGYETYQKAQERKKRGPAREGPIYKEVI